MTRLNLTYIAVLGVDSGCLPPRLAVLELHQSPLPDAALRALPPNPDEGQHVQEELQRTLALERLETAAYKACGSLKGADSSRPPAQANWVV